MTKEQLTGADLRMMIQHTAVAIDGAKDQLNSLDAALGDGDHGTSISAAFSAASDAISNLQNPTPYQTLQTTAMSLMNRMGGASGALFGTLFLRGSIAVKNEQTLTQEDLHRFFHAGTAGVMQRGGAKPGDKTMVDTLVSILKSLESTSRTDLGTVLANTAKEAMISAEATKDMIAQHGRAKFVGERSLGHPDAGAVTIATMMQAWSEVVNGEYDA